MLLAVDPETRAFLAMVFAWVISIVAVGRFARRRARRREES